LLSKWYRFPGHAQSNKPKPLLVGLAVLLLLGAVELFTVLVVMWAVEVGAGGWLVDVLPATILTLLAPAVEAGLLADELEAGGDKA
jgi:hypothetical protein